MQPIQDKDFDKLFENAFEDAEITPSRDLWSNIEMGLEQKKSKIVPVYWLSAAAILLVAVFTLLIFKQQDSVTGGKKMANNRSAVKQPVNRPDTVSSQAGLKPLVGENVFVSKKTTVQVKAKAIDKAVQEKQPQVKNALAIQKEETTLAKVNEPTKDLKTKIDEAILQQNNEVVLAANQQSVKIDEVADTDVQVVESENKSIRNVGDVVNLIVNKVDKRKEKFIQFRTDDDDSSISSINIGPFKFGKKRK